MLQQRAGPSQAQGLPGLQSGVSSVLQAAVHETGTWASRRIMLPRETDPSPVVSLMQTPGKGTSFAKLRGQLTLERWDSFASNCMFLLLGTAAKQIIPESNGWDL